MGRTMGNGEEPGGGTGLGVVPAGGELAGGGELTAGEVGDAEAGDTGMKPEPVTVTGAPATAIAGARSITGLPAVSPTVITAGDAGPGAPTMFVSMLNGALAHRAGLAFAHAVTVIGNAQETLPPANV
jgi:hypothetical protein